ncbi:hypothetical protein CC2G_011210 [Coprinopsis cinerea AmutBmut pab1-1]|nr:hypothetical protein CC2G_011210 [Coprinopsis cinerea AmutBmut pab1-1]
MTELIRITKRLSAKSSRGHWTDPGFWALIFSLIALGISAFLVSRHGDFKTGNQRVYHVFYFCILSFSIFTSVYVFILFGKFPEVKLPRKHLVYFFCLLLAWSLGAILMTTLHKGIYDGCFRDGEKGVHCGQTVALHVMVWIESIFLALVFRYNNDIPQASPSAQNSNDAPVASGSSNQDSLGVDLEMGVTRGKPCASPDHSVTNPLLPGPKVEEECNGVKISLLPNPKVEDRPIPLGAIPGPPEPR